MTAFSRGAALRRYRSRLLVAVSLAILPGTALAQDATWTGATNSNISTGTNWTPVGVPFGTLTFDNTAATNTVQNLTPATYNIGTFLFAANAPAYTFNFDQFTAIQVNNLGVVNNSANAVIFNMTNSSTLASNASTVNYANAVINLDATSNFYLNIGNDASTSRVNVTGGTIAFLRGGVGPSTGNIFLGSISGSGSVTIGGSAPSQGTPTANLGGNNLSTTFSGVISGPGSLVKTGTGTFTLTGLNSYTGGTTVTAGTLSIGTGGSLSSSGAVTVTGGTFNINGNSITVAALTGTGGTVNVDAFGTLSTYSSSTGTLASLVTGAGRLLKGGTGVYTISNANTFSGGLTIVDGTVLLNNNAAAGTGIVTITAPATLDLANGLTVANNIGLVTSGAKLNKASGSATLSGVISEIAGVRALEKAGAGTIILTGTSTYSGATTVSGGTLAVNGSIGGSAVTVAQGATLGGTGTVGATTVQSGGTLAPGNSIGTLSVNGNLTLASGSTYTVELSPAAADRTTVSGTASLNGTLALLPGAGTYTAGTTLTLLSANSVSGSFASVTGLSFPGVKSEIVYNATSVQLVLSPLAVNFAGRTPNQIAAAAALNAGPIGNPLQTALSNYLTANPAQMEAASRAKSMPRCAARRWKTAA